MRRIMIQDQRLGKHLHGFFRNHKCRTAFLAPILEKKNMSVLLPETAADPFGRWAQHVKSHLDWQKIEEIMEASL